MRGFSPFGIFQAALLFKNLQPIGVGTLVGGLCCGGAQALLGCGANETKCSHGFEGLDLSSEEDLRFKPH
jgi:hypothetical protein